jgi:hypothetical protein
MKKPRDANDEADELLETLLTWLDGMITIRFDMLLIVIVIFHVKFRRVD